MNPEAKSHYHVLPLRIYMAVAGALMVLTVVTVVVSFVNLGGWNAVTAVFIAALKASLVALFFMHLKYDKKINAIVFLAAILFLAIFLSFTFFDVLSRGHIYNEVEKPIKSKAAMYDAISSDSTRVGTVDTIQVKNDEQ